MSGKPNNGASPKRVRPEDRIVPALIGAGFLAAFLPALLLPVPGAVNDGGLAPGNVTGSPGHYEVVWVDEG